jgi:hypothetical protein
MATRTRPSARYGVAIVAGLAWTQLALTLESVVVPPRIELAPHVARTLSYRVAEWTLTAPLTVVARLLAATGRRESLVQPDFVVALASALFATTVCVGVSAALVGRHRRAAVRLALAATVLAALVSGAFVTHQLGDAVQAQREFFALVSHSPTPSADEATVAAAQAFVAHHPLSRWRAEALRIVAMHAWAHGRFAAAERVWAEFEATFDDGSAPGVAYALYSRALCFERLGNVREAIACHRGAMLVMTSRSDDIQAWIAPRAAARIAQLERLEGMPVTAAYYNAQSRTLTAVRSIQ